MQIMVCVSALNLKNYNANLPNTWQSNFPYVDLVPSSQGCSEVDVSVFSWHAEWDGGQA